MIRRPPGCGRCAPEISRRHTRSATRCYGHAIRPLTTTATCRIIFAGCGTVVRSTARTCCTLLSWAGRHAPVCPLLADSRAPHRLAARGNATRSRAAAPDAARSRQADPVPARFSRRAPCVRSGDHGIAARPSRDAVHDPAAACAPGSAVADGRARDRALLVRRGLGPRALRAARAAFGRVRISRKCSSSAYSAAPPPTRPCDTASSTRTTGTPTCCGPRA